MGVVCADHVLPTTWQRPFSPVAAGAGVGAPPFDAVGRGAACSRRRVTLLILVPAGRR